MDDKFQDILDSLPEKPPRSRLEPYTELIGEPQLVERVAVLESIRGVGEVTALTWALEICDPQRFRSIADAVSYCGLTSALDCSADRQYRGPISKHRNGHLQTVLIEATKLAPRWNPQLAQVHERELERGKPQPGHLGGGAQADRLFTAVDKSGQPFRIRNQPAPTTEVATAA
jgi:transposase